MSTLEYRIGTDTTEKGVRAKTRGPIRTKTMTVTAGGGFPESHRVAALALARKLNPGADVLMVSNDGYSRADWAITLPVGG